MIRRLVYIMVIDKSLDELVFLLSKALFNNEISNISGDDWVCLGDIGCGANVGC